ncbi:MAG: DNA-3-methyladenine glycosylase [Terrimicrobiaceae bacterium]
MGKSGTQLAAEEFDLGLTLNSGQIFHAMEIGEGIWEVLCGEKLLRLKQSGEGVEVLKGDPLVVARYLALDHPVGRIHASFPMDDYSQAALAECRGLRIIRQPLWECLATFLTSPMKQVAHIRQMSLAVRERFGKPVTGSLVQAYPEPDVVSGLDEAQLRACGLGFRAKNVLASARRIAEGKVDLEALRELPTEKLRETLCQFPGVGRKVANCVALFAYERLDAVPVDVWVARITTAMRKRKGSPLKLEAYAGRRFGPYAGYVQQYLFHHARTTGKLPGE